MTPRGLVTMAAMLAIGLAAAPAWAGATEANGALKLSCENGALSLKARDALAPEVFRALEKKCGLLLGGSENIPAQPLTVDYDKVSLEEVIESLIRLTGLPSTLLATVSSGALKLAVLATGTPITEPINGAEPTSISTFGLDGDEDEDAAIDEARRQFLLAQTYEERKRALEAMMRLDAEEARDLDNLNGDALEYERQDVGLEDARRRFLVAQSEEEKQKALEDARKLDPNAADELEEIDEEERREAALDDLLMQYYLSRTDEDRKRSYEAIKKLDPEEAKHLLLED
ncbi:MAG: hypothetical protein IH801_02545 [Nitrospinae bacterium]|nr:hypothetical protein [Nitrospinota bacterium]